MRSSDGTRAARRAGPGCSLAALCAAAIAPATRPPTGGRRPTTISVIVHPDNPTRALGRSFLRDAFLKKTTTWPSGRDHPSGRSGPAVPRPRAVHPRGAQEDARAAARATGTSRSSPARPCRRRSSTPRPRSSSTCCATAAHRLSARRRRSGRGGAGQHQVEPHARGAQVQAPRAAPGRPGLGRADHRDRDGAGARPPRRGAGVRHRDPLRAAARAQPRPQGDVRHPRRARSRTPPPRPKKRPARRGHPARPVPAIGSTSGRGRIAENGADPDALRREFLAYYRLARAVSSELIAEQAGRRPAGQGADHARRPAALRRSPRRRHHARPGPAGRRVRVGRAPLTAPRCWSTCRWPAWPSCSCCSCPGGSCAARSGRCARSPAASSACARRLQPGDPGRHARRVRRPGARGQPHRRAAARVPRAVAQEDWIKTGTGGLAGEIAGELSSPELGRHALTYLARYIGAVVGVAYAADEQGQLDLLEAYAFDPGPVSARSFRPGEGIWARRRATASCACCRTCRPAT